MGQFDFKFKTAYTSSLNSIASCILYSNNKTEDWLEENDPKEQEDIINSARSQR